MRSMKRDKPLPWPPAYEMMLVTRHFPELVRHAMFERRIAVRFYVAPVAAHAMFVTTDCLKGADPFVAMYCEARVGNIDDIPATILLAHELGHHESWLRGDTSDDFEHLMASTPRAVYDEPETLPRATKDEIVTEEARAWRYGRHILRFALPDFTAWGDYDRIAAESVEGYRIGLGLERV